MKKKKKLLAYDKSIDDFISMDAPALKKATVFAMENVDPLSKKKECINWKILKDGTSPSGQPISAHREWAPSPTLHHAMVTEMPAATVLTDPLHCHFGCPNFVAAKVDTL